MDNLPAEVLEPIFLLACRDGGRTGCALSLTSRYIRATSRSVRFHSVSLVSGVATQVVHFVASYSAACEYDKERRPRVRHLCIAAATRIVGNADGNQREEGVNPERKLRQQYLRDIMVLIDMVAPDVRTMCFINQCPTHSSAYGAGDLQLPSPITTAGFPALTELAVVGLRTVEFRAVDGTSMPFLPCLRTFHRIYVRDVRMQAQHYMRKSDAILMRWKTRGAQNISDVKVVLVECCSSECDLLGKLRDDRRIRWSFANMLAPYVPARGLTVNP
ncbi:hypothetical protein BN946_scf184983.g33 [Trametes cinnabarina]|uniref:F-box domain-containing protein n=1 Tax=Pycnoporus cinnabarinus TaxID=5643 RepID=A0A060SDV0_PYCCI|nr:hypothetical protein BN946_scf184983.g33 [Trametes cinnabarina]